MGVLEVIRFVAVNNISTKRITRERGGTKHKYGRRKERARRLGETRESTELDRTTA